VLLCGGLLTDFLTRKYSLISPYLRWIGAAYMIWLAVSLFLPSRKKGGSGRAISQGYLGGLLLQFINPKGILFGITIYTSFSSLLTGTPMRTLASALFLTAVGFAAISAWSLVGALFSALFARPVFRFAFNALMAILLLYSALSILLH
jgi:cysteine/O-acetylserine efflux protein